MRLQDPHRSTPAPATRGAVAADARPRGPVEFQISDTSRCAARTAFQAAAARGAGVPAEQLNVIRGAIARREQVWAYRAGRLVRLCPHALGWREDEPYVLALVLRERPGGAIEGARWERLLGWEWLPVAALESPCPRRGDWITCPREQRPPTDFLSIICCEAE